MLYKLDRYDKNEAPVVVYRFVNDEAIINQDGNYQIIITDNDIKIKLNVNDFFTLISKLNGNVWIIANGENTVVREALESFKMPNLFVFYLIEFKKVLILYMHCICILCKLHYMCNILSYI